MVEGSKSQGKEHENGRDGARDPPGACRQVASAKISDAVLSRHAVERETELDCSTLTQLEREFSTQIPEQIFVPCCYGRGKGIGDIPVPRLPKKFQGDTYAGARTSTFDHMVSQTNAGSGSRPEQHNGCGRGRILEMQSSCIDTDKVSSVSTVNPRSQSLLSTDYRDDYNICSRRTRPTKYDCKSKEDFPSLSGSSSPNPTSISRNRTTKHQQKSRHNQRKDSESSDVFADADESVLETRSGGGVNICTDRNSEYSGTESDGLSTKQRTSSGVSNPSSLGSLSEPNDLSRISSSSSFDMLSLKDANDIDMKSETETDTSAAEAETNSKFDTDKSKTNNADTSLCGAAAITADEIQGQQAASDKKGKQKNKKTPRQRDDIPTDYNGEGAHAADRNNQESEHDARIPEEKDGGSPKDGVSAAEDVAPKTKKKVPGSWKLDGMGILLHVENVPKSCGGKLKEYVAAFGKILDEEKKTQKGTNSWRFRFENQTDCDFAISCLDGADSLFEGCTTALKCYRPGESINGETSV